MQLKQITACMAFTIGAFLNPRVTLAQTPAESDNATDQTVSITKQVAELRPGETHFMVVGLATFGFVNQSVANTLGGVKTTDKTNSLGDADRYEFSPMMLWRHGDHLLLEFEPSYDGVSLGVNWFTSMISLQIRFLRFHLMGCRLQCSFQ